MNDVWCNSVIGFGCVRSRVLRVKLKFLRVKVCVFVVYEPSEWDIEKKKKFWNDLNKVVDRIGNGNRLCALVDLNGWVIDSMKEGITVAFGVPGERDNVG